MLSVIQNPPRIALPIVGSSDVGTPAALWALELDPSTQVSLVVSTTAEK